MYGPAKFVTYAISEIRRKIWLEPFRNSYSQNGEDLLIHKILKNKKKGFYVDIGTNDPVRFNNTKHFSVIGWKGINIEPDINCFVHIQKDRPRDINLNIGVGNSKSKLTFFKLNPDTLSTFSQKDAKKSMRMGYTLVSKNNIQVKPLSEILKNFLKNKTIDFMSIDTEGYDKYVLQSNNWSKYRPRIICVESVEHNEKHIGKDTGLGAFFAKIGYKKYIDNGINCIYLDKISQ